MIFSIISLFASLFGDFINPPPEYRPEMWLFGMGDNLPNEVITLDLERLSGVGIGSVMIYGYYDDDPRFVYGKMALSNRPELVTKLKWVLHEANRLGLKVSLCIGPIGCGNELQSDENTQKDLVFVKPGESDPDCFRLIKEIKAPSQLRIGWVPKKVSWLGLKTIDPLRREALDEHWRHCVQPLLDAVAPDERAAFYGVLCDSWEAGDIGWTQRMPEEFLKRRGYPIDRVLLAKAGLVEDAAEADSLLRDFDETVTELFAENHYAYQKELAHRNGLVSEGEACGPSQHFADARRLQGRCDNATGEFWMPSAHRQADEHRFMVRDAAATAHVYGLPEVRAESFTTLDTHWVETPVMMKTCADRAFCDGLTKILHHGMLFSNPIDELPGATRRAGVYYSPKVTWFRDSAPMNRYFARCGYMLSRGSFAADCLLYAGDAKDFFVRLKTHDDALGPGYDYDLCPTDLLLESRVENGEIVLPCGQRYRTLFVSDKSRESTNMNPWPRPTESRGEFIRVPPEAEAKLRQLREAGATVFFTRAERDAWLKRRVLEPDFVGEGVDWLHRSLGSTEIYFVANYDGAPKYAEVSLRVENAGAVELWDAMTGLRREVDFSCENGRTGLHLALPAYGSKFIVVHRREVLSGPWKVEFHKALGGPEEAEFAELVDWTTRSEPGIRNYSGTARYSHDLTADEPGRVRIDLGLVHGTARVKLNGRYLGIAWASPFVVEGEVKKGVNHLEIEVTNVWANRLIGDAALPEEQRICRLPKNPYKAGAPLCPSGLIGPVTITRSLSF